MKLTIRELRYLASLTSPRAIRISGADGRMIAHLTSMGLTFCDGYYNFARVGRTDRGNRILDQFYNI